ncbi:MAG: hypothetical protein R2751_11380 [Bacteroidales bacterium]
METATGDIPALEAPYVIENPGVKVGIIGLASTNCPHQHLPQPMWRVFLHRLQPPWRHAPPGPGRRGHGASGEVGHLCSGEMSNLTPEVARRLGICFIGGGHCHERYLNTNESTVFLQAGSNMTAYGRVSFDYDPSDSTTANFNQSLVTNTASAGDEAIQDIVAY